MLNIVDKHGNKVIEVFDNRYDAQVHNISLSLRDNDFDEVFASTGDSPHYAILEGWKTSLRKWIMLNKNNEAVAVLGVVPVDGILSDIGIPWLLGTDGLTKMKKFFIKSSKIVIKEMLKHFKILVNFVDSRYDKAIKWLKWCGFILDENATYNPTFNGVLFYRYYMRSI